MLYQDRIYGQIEISEPVILKLIKTPLLERLKKIHANGIYFYFYPQVNVNKFDHSLGVWHLLKTFGASLDEQVAGLLHDVSHKVLAHVIDHFYGSHIKEDHQDNIHLEVLKNGQIDKILGKYNLDLEKIGQLNNWPLLDNELPNLCADRLDYTLRDATQVDFINQMTIGEIIKDLSVNDKGFVFNNLEPARKFGNLSLRMNQEHWHSDWGNQSFEIMAEILHYALKKNIMTLDDFWLGDQELLDKLESVKDLWIDGRLQIIKKIRQLPVSGTKEDHDLVFPYKFRAVDPWIKNQRLSQLDAKFKKDFLHAEETARAGHYIKLVYEK